MQPQDERPPYVDFKVTAVEDRTATLANGYLTMKDIDIAVVIPPGSKDRVERPVEEWFAQLTQQVAEGRFRREWLDTLKINHKYWKEGQEVPPDGFPIANWPVLSPSQVSNLKNLHVLTLEALAGANEETITRMGMGARNLVQQAKDWLDASSTAGQLARQMEALRAEHNLLNVERETLKKVKADLTEEVTMLKARLPKAQRDEHEKIIAAKRPQVEVIQEPTVFEPGTD